MRNAKLRLFRINKKEYWEYGVFEAMYKHYCQTGEMVKYKMSNHTVFCL